jgi:transcriptional regulator of acetoin/glycerol metabolism
MVVTQNDKLNIKDFLLNRGSEMPEFSSSLSLDEVEKTHILNVLENNNWNISFSAQILEIDRVTIYKKLQKYGIKRPQNA